MRETTSRFTVSVPTDLLEAVERKVAMEDEGRSALVRRLFEAALRDIEEREKVERYVQGYQRQPQKKEEFGWSDQVAAQSLTESSW